MQIIPKYGKIKIISFIPDKELNIMIHVIT